MNKYFNNALSANVIFFLFVFSFLISCCNTDNRNHSMQRIRNDQALSNNNNDDLLENLWNISLKMDSKKRPLIFENLNLSILPSLKKRKVSKGPSILSKNLVKSWGNSPIQGTRNSNNQKQQFISICTYSFNFKKVN